MPTALLAAAFLILAPASAAPSDAERRAADLITVWTLCLHGASDAEASAGLASADAAGAAVERSLTACAREEEAIRAELVLRRGAAAAGPILAGFRERVRATLARRLEPSIGPAADPVMAATRAHGNCNGTHVAAGAVGSSDPPAAIVEAALVRCAPYEARIRSALLARGAPAADADAFVETLRRQVRDTGPGLVEQVRGQMRRR